jgi:hypothetical protein
VLRGSFWVLVLYDVAERIELDKLREILGVGPALREPRFEHPAPDYVRFERGPVVEYREPAVLETGETFQVCIKYFDYGVISIELSLEFKTGWDELVRMSSKWIDAPGIGKCTDELLGVHLQRARAALFQPYEKRLSEDYYVVHLEDSFEPDGSLTTATALLERHGNQIAQLIRGDSQALSEAEQNEALQSRMSYYPDDLLVVGWVAAFVYDSMEGAAPTMQLLEYANAQLLEFRHYDDLLTGVLENVYKMLERKGSLFRHWKMARQAEKLNAMRLEVTELTERTDTAIKFLSDMYYARAYKVAAARVGVTDYRKLVERKLKIAGDLYESMVEGFHQSRAFVLEMMVVAILIIELFHAYQGGK